MGFWANVEAEREYQGLTRKELAWRAGISYTGIGLGLERNSMPGADTAMRISMALGVTIEYLLLGDEAKTQNGDYQQRSSDERALLTRYRSILQDLDQLPEHIKKPICEMIHRMAHGSVPTHLSNT